MAAHDTSALERAARLGDGRILTLGVSVLLQMDDTLVPRPVESICIGCVRV